MKTLAVLLFGILIPGILQAASPKQSEVFQKLFHTTRYGPFPYTKKHTFIFFVNGDADHFVPESKSTKDPYLYQTDKVEVFRLLDQAVQCPNCNFLILYVNRGGTEWYAPKEPFETHLYAISGGDRLFTRSVGWANAADPRLISNLLAFSDWLFPGSQDRHFIYRGKEFIPAYDPSNPRSRIAPFAFGHPQSPFGLGTFTIGIKNAHLRRKLDSIVLTGCSMSYFGAAADFSPFANYMIASQVPIVETPGTSFQFGILTSLASEEKSRALTGKEVSEQIAAHLTESFDRTDSIWDAEMEYPVTWVDLENFDRIEKDWIEAHELLNSRYPNFIRDNTQALLRAAKVEKVISNRYAAYLALKGKSERSIREQIRFVRIRSKNPREFDLGGYVQFILTSDLSDEVKERFRVFLSNLKSDVKIYRGSSFSSKSGISFLFPPPMYPIRVNK